jgi:hypothetical protein
MRLDIIYSFKVMEGMVKPTWKLDILSSLPHVRGCASRELYLELRISMVPRWRKARIVKRGAWIASSL